MLLGNDVAEHYLNLSGPIHFTHPPSLNRLTPTGAWEDEEEARG